MPLTMLSLLVLVFDAPSLLLLLAEVESRMRGVFLSLNPGYYFLDYSF